MILVGADIPDLAPACLVVAAAALGSHPTVIGPATDGGYHLLGLRESVLYLSDAMPWWGTDAVLATTAQRLSEQGGRPAFPEAPSDLDRPGELAHWPDLVA